MNKKRDIYLLNSKLERFLAAIEYLNLEFPVAEISNKTKYSAPSVSQMIAGNRNVSTKFLETFCKIYDFDVEKLKYGLVPKENLELLTNNIDSHTVNKKLPQSQVQKVKNQSLDLPTEDYRNIFSTLLPTPNHRNNWIPSYPNVSFIRDNYPAIINDLQDGGENILMMTEDKPNQLYRIPDTIVDNQTIIVTVREENCSPEYKPGENILITKIDIDDIDFGRSYYVVFKSKSERIYVVEKIEGDYVTLSNSNPDERYRGKKVIKIEKIDMIFVITYGLRKKIQ